MASKEENVNEAETLLRDIVKAYDKMQAPATQAIRSARADAYYKAIKRAREFLKPHASDCAVHNAPALPVGQCNCRS